MAREATEQLIRTGFKHLARFAFHTRDNPFLTRQASLSFEETDHEDLASLIDGEVTLQDWLGTRSAKRLLRGIKVGSVPRDVELLVRDAESVVGVDSVHAFLNAPLFWWLVSILWCTAIAEEVEPLLGEGIRAYRFQSSFLEDPGQSGLMFRDQQLAQKSWKRFPQEVREENPGEFVTNATLDLRAFYYSIDARPRDICNRFFAAGGRRAPQTRAIRVLTGLLGELHRRYASQCEKVAPRANDLEREGRSPLPVGLPSSQVLANMIVSLVVSEFEGLEDTIAIAAYADDITVMTKLRPELREKAPELFARLGLIEAEAPYELRCEATKGMGRLTTSEEKMAVSYTRYVPPEDEAEERAMKSFLEKLGFGEDSWTASFEGDNADWGGRLRTVLRTPHKRERVPVRLRNELLELRDEVRLEVEVEELAHRFRKFLEELDRRLVVALRPYWCELIVVAIAAQGLGAVKVLTTQVREIVESVELPEGATEEGYVALRFGLRQSWYQALAQALAVATDREDRDQLVALLPKVRLEAKRSLSMKGVIGRARKIRSRRLIPRSLVAVPLAEFSEWDGALIGRGAFEGFLEWCRSTQPKSVRPEELAGRVGESLRFVTLQEVCLAVHLWACGEPGDWLEDVFRALRAQPLIDQGLVEELRTGAEIAVEPPERSKEEPDEDSLEALRPRIGMPSLQVPSKQLKAIVEEDASMLDAIASESRKGLKKVVGFARETADVLVMPEWSILPQLLSWVMEQAARRQTLIIGGQTPEVVGSTYWNLLWVGIPLVDSADHRACLVLPPRQKRFLSPHEEATMAKGKLEKGGSQPAEVPVYAWRGMRFASLLCFEFADIDLRRQLRFEADALTVSSLNRDWRYFDAVQDSTSRDNYCLTVCVNTGSFPGTRIVRPTKSEMAVAAAVHGSDNPTLITKRIDMRPIVAAQAHTKAPKKVLEGYEPADGIPLKKYKPFPPTF